jgi:thioredoxin reductase
MRVLAAGGRGWLTHQKTMMPNWIDDITWADIDELTSVEDDGDLKVTFSDGSVASYERLFVEQIQVLRDGLADALGCERADAGFVSVGPLGETSVPGVYSAGDQSQKAQQVNLAVGAGHQAGMGVLIALSAEDRAHRSKDDGGA